LPALKTDTIAALLTKEIKPDFFLGAGASFKSGIPLAGMLAVPIAYKLGTVADSAPQVSDEKDELLMRLLGSDFPCWAALKLARDQVFRCVLATPPEQIAGASAQERARVNGMADQILPVSIRVAGLRDDTRLGKSLGPYQLKSVRAPTSVRRYARPEVPYLRVRNSSALSPPSKMSRTREVIGDPRWERNPAAIRLPRP
jgi:hypothetical protein